MYAGNIRTLHFRYNIEDNWCFKCHMQVPGEKRQKRRQRQDHDFLMEWKYGHFGILLSKIGTYIEICKESVHVHCCADRKTDKAVSKVYISFHGSYLHPGRVKYIASKINSHGVVVMYCQSSCKIFCIICSGGTTLTQISSANVHMLRQ